jgi:threonine synthase
MKKQLKQWVIYGTSGYSRTTWRRGLFRAKKELLNYPNAIGIFLETAHPIKFLDVVEPTLNVKLPIPAQIESVIDKENY